LSRKVQPKRINLALQGGGAHGAYTWGVLDRLLAEPDLRIEGISGTSAGAMNAAVLAAGYAAGGAEGARELLDRFWRGLAKLDRFSPICRTPFDYLTGITPAEKSFGIYMMHGMVRAFSPYQLNPGNYNPLRGLIDELVDFDALKAFEEIKLFIAATNVRSGKVRIFEHQDLSTDVLLASACLPDLFQAVEIDGEHYWDGGFVGNPSIYPLIYRCTAPDVLLVQVIPLHRPELPTTAFDIVNRTNEINFNAAIIAEMRAIQFVTRLIDSGKLNDPHYKRMFVHMIEAEDDLAPLGAASKLNSEWAFLRTLHDIGQAAASRWVESNFDALGKRSTVDLGEIFL
jgi:NTE family protein